ncbi:hypothetical protein TeGR_g12610 [Tetraparma gracilis]|uniref:Uncharacterized protein n=1 Tax=Tetraparma gracilis TaxID=2962635 RepID=A0ABQ6M4M3_9STRA|nr:hypothetical protein TeGR_g12610 [Tetraparma gracilis]
MRKQLWSAFERAVKELPDPAKVATKLPSTKEVRGRIKEAAEAVAGIAPDKKAAVRRAEANYRFVAEQAKGALGAAKSSAGAAAREAGAAKAMAERAARKGVEQARGAALESVEQARGAALESVAKAAARQIPGASVLEAAAPSRDAVVREGRKIAEDAMKGGADYAEKELGERMKPYVRKGFFWFWVWSLSAVFVFGVANALPRAILITSAEVAERRMKEEEEKGGGEEKRREG